MNNKDVFMDEALFADTNDTAMWCFSMPAVLPGQEKKSPFTQCLDLLDPK